MGGPFEYLCRAALRRKIDHFVFTFREWPGQSFLILLGHRQNHIVSAWLGVELFDKMPQYGLPGRGGKLLYPGVSIPDFFFWHVSRAVILSSLQN